ncbi:MAG: 3-dehydroquinate synthase, partial [Prevotella sp.]|nr:3-dehydroquinate synthase [Prevotella sp.]
MQRIIISTDLDTELSQAIENCEHDRIFILTDETTHRLCLPLVKDFDCLKDAEIITIGASDVNKTLESTACVWEKLQKGGATRHSLLINLGGGMVTDLGGFAASTFKRGINFINIPTTLLSMVDASVGGKTGFNFGGLKNEIGVFNDSKYVILSTSFLKSLDSENIASGYAEMLKHGLINRKTNAMWAELINFDLAHPDLGTLQRMVAESVAIKEEIVE